MKQGDFSLLAEDYKNRPGYSEPVLRQIHSEVARRFSVGFKVVDVGAGTGKLTQHLISLGLSGWAVEPNDSMRGVGQRDHGAYKQIEWKAGPAEEIPLEAGCAGWLLMASAFHWTDAPRALKEFARILKPQGVLTLLWNPRDLEKNPLQLEIDEMIGSKVPGLQRKSSGAKPYTIGLEETILGSGLFKDVIFMEASHVERMTPARYLGAWRSVNDIQAQAGPVIFEDIMSTIEKMISGMNEVVVPYKTRAWVASRK